MRYKAFGTTGLLALCKCCLSARLHDCWLRNHVLRQAPRNERTFGTGSFEWLPSTLTGAIKVYARARVAATRGRCLARAGISTWNGPCLRLLAPRHSRRDSSLSLSCDVPVNLDLRWAAPTVLEILHHTISEGCLTTGLWGISCNENG